MKKLITILFILTNIYAYPQFLTHFEKKKKEKDTIKVIMITSDTCDLNGEVEWIKGYAVRELKSSLDAGTPLVTCCDWFWKEMYYMDENGKLLPKSVMVWQTIPSNWTQHDSRETTHR